MAKHPGDDGNWNLDSADDPPGSIRDRVNTQLSLVSREQIEVMREEERFVASVASQFPMKRFTDRRTPADRNNLLPHGADRQVDVSGGSYITQRD